MIGGHIFSVETNLTGIELDVEVINDGAPSVAKNWTLRILLANGTQLSCQPSRFPPVVPLRGATGGFGKIEASQELDTVTAIGKKPRSGALLFYKQVEERAVLDPDTILMLTVQDKNDKTYTTHQRIGDWPKSPEPR